METGKKNWFARHKIITGLIVFTILIVVFAPSEEGAPSSSTNSSMGESAEEATKEKVVEIAKISASDLFKAYDANELAADEKYKGKTLEISGVIGELGKDILGSPYILLRPSGVLVFGVQCMLDDSEQASKASQLSKGASVTLTGDVSGKLGNIVVRNCTIK